MDCGKGRQLDAALAKARRLGTQDVWETLRRWTVSSQKNSWNNAELDLNSKAFKKYMSHRLKFGEPFK